MDVERFGSVPLQTYLPDGDLDVSIIQRNGEELKESWIYKIESKIQDLEQDS